MKKKLAKELFEKKYNRDCPHLCRDTIIQFLNETIFLLFPQLGQESYETEVDLELAISNLELKLKSIFKCIHKELGEPEEEHVKIINKFFENLCSIESMLAADANYMATEDPASVSIDEVIICYPGFFAIATYRIASFFYKEGIPIFPRVLSEYAHERTGIDIHPGAQIGHPFFIDHGTGVVIGETTVIGNHCKLFQGVTLGALSVKRKWKERKRHPTIGDHVLIYSNAAILGGDTVIGSNTTIGGNVWITESIPESSQVFRVQGFNVSQKASTTSKGASTNT